MWPQARIRGAGEEGSHGLDNEEQQKAVAHELDKG